MDTNPAITQSTLRPEPDSAATAERIGNATPTSARALSVRALTHSYGGGAAAVEDVSFDVPAGEIVALLGPSGCGKSTVLRAIAGLIQPKRGTIALGTADLTVLSARARGIGMVFQNYALFPHLTVAENIAYPLACQHVARPERRARVGELLALIRLDGFGSRLPRELSGGQQQRVAVARALASRPSLLLLDEPFGALDRALRFDLQVEMLRLQKSLGITTLIVTHDQEEAQSLATQLVLMNRGRVEQIDSPTVVYDRPKTLFVNSFIGQASQLSGTVESPAGGNAAIRLATGDRPSPGAQSQLHRRCAGGRHLPARRRSPPGGTRPTTLEARLTVSVPLGPTLVHDLELADGTAIRATEVRGATGSPAMPGDQVSIQIDTDRCHVFPRDTGS